MLGHHSVWDDLYGWLHGVYNLFKVSPALGSHSAYIFPHLLKISAVATPNNCPEKLL